MAADRVWVAVVGRPASDWRAGGLARATLAHLCRVQRVCPTSARAAQRLVPVKPGSAVADVADAGKLLQAQWVVVVEARATGGAGAELTDVAAGTRKTLSAEGRAHELPVALARALAGAMGLEPPPAERARIAAPLAASHDAIEALWQGDAAHSPADRLRFCQQAARRDPNSALAQNRLGAALARLGRRDQALRAFARAAELDTRYPAPHTNRGLVLAQQKRWAQAEAAFRRAIEMGAKSPTPRVGLARLLDRLGATREAVEQLEQAVALDPCHTEALMTLADVYFAQQRVRESSRAVERVLALEPENLAALNLLGLVQMAPRDYEAAEATLRKALAIDPDSASTLANLGLALYGQHRTREAVASIERAIALAPTLAKAHFYLGQIHLEQQHYDEAVAALQRAVECDPHLLAARQSLAAARAHRRARGGLCGCLPSGGGSTRRAALPGALVPVALLLAPHLGRLARRRRRRDRTKG